MPEVPAPRISGPVSAVGVGTILAGAIQQPAGSSREVAAQPEDRSQILLAAEVDEAVVVLLQGRPIYPPRLSALGIPGRVVLEFVVDTAGNVEGSSVRIVESTLAEFEPAAKAAVAASRFRAARVRNQAVRQLVRQAVSFRVP
jgi:TonB family protein